MARAADTRIAVVSKGAGGDYDTETLPKPAAGSCSVTFGNLGRCAQVAHGIWGLPYAGELCLRTKIT
jgi:hypothetical protein